MKKFLLAIALGTAAVAAVPALAMARTEHHHSHHSARHGNSRVRHEHFGSRHDEASASAPVNAPDAGMIASFNNGVLTIKLADGSMVSGHVTTSTEVKCEIAEPAEMEHSVHGDGDHGGESDNNRGGDGNGDNHGNDEQKEQMCSSANLVSGTPVSNAELTSSVAGAIWNEVELAG